MTKSKFNEDDRDEVVRWYKDKQGIELTLSRRRKYFEGSDRKRYCLLGSCEHYEQWHGIDKDIIDDPGWENAILIIAVATGNGFDIFEGPFKQIIQNKSRLALADKNDGSKQYEFNTKLEQGNLIVKEIFDYSLNKIGQCPSGFVSRKAVYEKMIAVGIKEADARSISGYTQ